MSNLIVGMSIPQTVTKTSAEPIFRIQRNALYKTQRAY